MWTMAPRWPSAGSTSTVRSVCSAPADGIAARTAATASTAASPTARVLGREGIDASVAVDGVAAVAAAAAQGEAAVPVDSLVVRRPVDGRRAAPSMDTTPAVECVAGAIGAQRDTPGD